MTKPRRRKLARRLVPPPPPLTAGTVLDLGATAVQRRASRARSRPPEASVRRDWEAVGRAWAMAARRPPSP